jgi:hypothetical protein
MNNAGSNHAKLAILATMETDMKCGKACESMPDMCVDLRLEYVEYCYQAFLLVSVNVFADVI